MRTEDLSHDLRYGRLNDTDWHLDRGQDPMLIPSIPCEVCGQSIWLGIIVSSCGDAALGIWQQNVKDNADEGFELHVCAGYPDQPDDPDCLVCFPDDEEEDEEEDDLELNPVTRLRFLSEPPTWTTLPVAR